MARFLILSLAGLLAATAASARDLPRTRTAPRPSDCQEYGPGFTRVEGTDTCVRLSGEVRAEVTVSSNGSGLK